MSKLDKDYERGFDAGYIKGKLAAEGVDLEALTARLNYLRKGGTWGKAESDDPYLAGFRDAMLTLGMEVK